jgi:hypothetical protein
MPRPQRSALLPCCALTLLAACGVVQGAADAPGKLADMVFPGTQTKVPPPDQVLKDLLQFADQITLRANVALREFELRAGTPEAAIQSAQWQLEILRLSTQHAASPNSFSSLLDLSLLVTLCGWLQEDVWAAQWGDAVQPVHRALTDLQEEGWRLLARNCDPKHLEEMRALLRKWREEHPKLTRASILELPSFTSLLEQSPADTGGSSSLLGIVGLDPLAGLEPTAREIERSRELAERLLFFVERAPRLVSLEIELRVLQARRSDEVRQVLADMGRVTTSLESFANTAAGLPASISREREAALKQIDDTLSQQRTGLLRDLDTAQAPLGSVLEKTQTCARRRRTHVGGADARAASSRRVRRTRLGPQGRGPRARNRGGRAGSVPSRQGNRSTSSTTAMRQNASVSPRTSSRRSSPRSTSACPR